MSYTFSLTGAQIEARLSLANSALQPSAQIGWGQITSVPAEFPPESHTHTLSQITDWVATLATLQPLLASGTNIRTVNGQSLLGSGDLTVGTGAGTVTSVAATGGQGVTVTGGPITGAGTLTVTGPDLISEAAAIAGSNTGIRSWSAFLVRTAITGWWATITAAALRTKADLGSAATAAAEDFAAQSALEATDEAVVAVAGGLGFLQQNGVIQIEGLSATDDRPEWSGSLIWPAAIEPTITDEAGVLTISLSAPPAAALMRDSSQQPPNLYVPTLTGNRTLAPMLKGGAALAAGDAGDTGRIIFVQDGTGGRTVTLDDSYTYVEDKTPQVGGALPLNAGAGARSIFYFDVISPTEVILVKLL